MREYVIIMREQSTELKQMDSSIMQWQAVKITELKNECQRLHDENQKLLAELTKYKDKYEKVKEKINTSYGESLKLPG